MGDVKQKLQISEIDQNELIKTNRFRIWKIREDRISREDVEN